MRLERLTELPTDTRQQVEKLLALDRAADDVFATDAGQRWLPATETPDVPARIGRFSIIAKRGEGGMGVVYEAEQDHPRRRVALKVLHPRLRRPEVLRLFHFEAQALAQVGHPAIPEVFEAATTDDGTIYLSMELVDGRSLSDWTRQTRASPTDRIRLLIGVAHAVHACHEAGVIHRDLKPSNILVTDEGEPKVLDFGVALPAFAGPSPHPGTRGYMSPEARDGAALDARSDVFALGCIGYELLTGRRPGERPPPAHHIEPGLDPDVSRVLRRALETDRNARTPSADAFAADLLCTVELRALPWRPDRRYRLGRFARRHRRALLLATTGMAVATAGWATHLWQEVQREDQAMALLDAVRPALSEDGPEGVRRFVRRDDVVGTSAVAAAWLAWAEARQGTPQQLDGLAQAYLTATAPAQADAARRRLAERFHDTARWEALLRLSDSLTPGDRAALAEPLRLANLALRRPVAFASTAHPVLQALGRGEPLGITAFKAGWIGDQLAAFDHDAITFDATGEADRFPVAHPQGWTSIANVAVAEGADGARTMWMATGNGRSNALLYRDLEPVAQLPRSAVQAVAVVDDEVFVALSYPDRGLFVFDGEGVAVPFPSVNALESDVMDVVAGDLDDDGNPDLVVSIGAWGGYVLQRWERTDAGWVKRAEVPQGVVMDLHVEGDRIYAGKVDMEMDLRRFGEVAPYGPPAGIYVYDADLRQVDLWPLPVADDPATGSKRSVEDPIAGDFDGDGVREQVWTLNHHHRDVEHLLWIVGHGVIAGLEGHDARDVDGDGDDELLVGDEHGRLWLLGTGDEPLPPWNAAPRTGLDADLSVDTSTWRRADELVDMGLVTEAAQALTSAARVETDGPLVAAYLDRAASLFASARRPDRAAAQLERALERAPGHPRAPDWSTRLRDLRLELPDLEGAREVWTDPPDWVDAVEPLDLLPHLRFERSAFRRRDGGPLEATVFNDHGVVARLPVDIVAPWVQLDLASTLHQTELGAGLAVDLVRSGPDGDETLLTVGWWIQGGGDAEWLYQNCGDDALQWLEPERDVQTVQLSAARSAPIGLRCRQRLEQRPRWGVYASDPVEPGPAEIVLRAHGDSTYKPPTRVRFTLEHLTAHGLALRDLPPTPRQAWLASIVDGRTPEGPAPSGLERRAALARGDLETWGALLRQAPPHEQAWALRTHGLPALDALEPLGPERFSAVLHTALDGKHRVDDPDVRQALFAPRLGSFPLTTPAGRALRLWRAEAWQTQGNPGAARRLLASVAQTDTPEGATARRALGP